MNDTEKPKVPKLSKDVDKALAVLPQEAAALMSLMQQYYQPQRDLKAQGDIKDLETSISTMQRLGPDLARAATASMRAGDPTYFEGREATQREAISHIGEGLTPEFEKYYTNILNAQAVNQFGDHNAPIAQVNTAQALAVENQRTRMQNDAFAAGLFNAPNLMPTISGVPGSFNVNTSNAPNAFNSQALFGTNFASQEGRSAQQYAQALAQYNTPSAIEQQPIVGSILATTDSNPVRASTGNQVAWNTTIGLLGAAGGAAGAFCWVAREVLGTDTTDWQWFRVWMLLDSPWWFRAIYLRFGERFAAWLHDKPAIKAQLCAWFLCKADTARRGKLAETDFLYVNKVPVT